MALSLDEAGTLELEQAAARVEGGLYTDGGRLVVMHHGLPGSVLRYGDLDASRPTTLLERTEQLASALGRYVPR